MNDIREKLIDERDAWRETAAQLDRDKDYYRGLVVTIGEMFGVDARTQDDGGVAEDVLCAKVPELVKALAGRSEYDVCVAFVERVMARDNNTPYSPTNSPWKELKNIIKAELESMRGTNEHNNPRSW